MATVPASGALLSSGRCSGCVERIREQTLHQGNVGQSLKFRHLSTLEPDLPGLEQARAASLKPRERPASHPGGRRDRGAAAAAMRQYARGQHLRAGRVGGRAAQSQHRGAAAVEPR